MSKRPKKILSEPLGQDDFGFAFYKCQYTGKVVQQPNHIFLGAVLPQVSGSYVCDPGATPFRRAASQQLAELDQNCNTCRNLERLPHEKQHPAATLTGKCLNQPYKPVVRFHPEDWMGMSCWQARS